MDEIENLKEELKLFLLNVDKQNFFKSYDRAIYIVESYRGKQLDKSDVIQALNDLDDTWEMDQYQEEVFLEVSKVLQGYASDIDNIDWW